jgi:hypothetical protein
MRHLVVWPYYLSKSQPVPFLTKTSRAALRRRIEPTTPRWLALPIPVAFAIGLKYETANLPRAHAKKAMLGQVETTSIALRVHAHARFLKRKGIYSETGV